MDFELVCLTTAATVFSMDALQDKTQKATISGIEMFHKTLDEGQSGDQPGPKIVGTCYCCILLLSSCYCYSLLQPSAFSDNVINLSLDVAYQTC